MSDTKHRVPPRSGHTKARMMEKLLELTRRLEEQGENGILAKGFILNYSNKCNFHCKHCYTRSGAGEFGETLLTMEDVKRLADQADALGVYEIDIQGGEPLLLPNLFDVLEMIDTSRFYVYITTNGWLLDEAMAKRLAEAGVDRVSVSIDAFTPEAHDVFRGMSGAYQRAISALGNAQKAGLAAYVNTVVGHYNAQSKELADFVDYLAEHHWGVVFNCATPTGNWRGNYDAMLTPEDSACLERLRERNNKIIRDLWNYFDWSGKKIYGCPAANLFYVSPKGDVLPCPFIQTKLGNIRETPLKEILKRGFSVKWFREYSDRCLAGENKEFAQKYLDHDMTVLNPIPLEELFAKEDFLHDGE